LLFEYFDNNKLAAFVFIPIFLMFYLIKMLFEKYHETEIGKRSCDSFGKNCIFTDEF
jgi:hypothetical protein